MARSGVRVTQDHVRDLVDGLAELTSMRLLVGIPEDRAARQEDDAHGTDPEVNNAELGYIHEFGAPEVDIPQRPFLVPGVQQAQPQVARRMKRAGQAALDGKPKEVARQFASCGIEVVGVIQARMEAGLSPPLSASYMRDRDYGVRDSSSLEKYAEHMDARRPLIDTGQLLRSITYVVEYRGRDAARAAEAAAAMGE